MKLHYGIISCASIVPRFIEAVKAYGDEVSAIASRSQKKAEDIANAYNISKAYGSYETLYMDSNIDIVYIATTNATHAYEIKNALLHHKHVICEKPLTLDEKEATSLFAFAKQQKCFLMEAQKSVFLPVTLAIKQYINSLKLGRLHQIELCSSFPNPQANWMHDPKQGGVIFGSAAYTLEYLDFLCEPQSVKVQAQGILESNGTCERVSINMVMDDILINSRISMHGDTLQHAIFYFEHGYITVPSFWKAREYYVTQDETTECYQHPVKFEMIYEVEHIHDCIQNGLLESPVMSAQHSITCIGFTRQIAKDVAQIK